MAFGKFTVSSSQVLYVFVNLSVKFKISSV